MRDDSVRRTVVARLRVDLVGPGEPSEELPDLASDRYLTGILFPPRTEPGAAEDDDAETVDEGAEADVAPEAVSTSLTFRPSSAGLSFAVRPGPDGLAGIAIAITAGQYEAVPTDPGRKWRRRPLEARYEHILDQTGLSQVALQDHGIAGLALHLRVSRSAEIYLVTVAISNALSLDGVSSRQEIEENTFFQVALKVTAELGASICAKPAAVQAAEPDHDEASAALIYRDVGEYAVGHTCSAAWDEVNGEVSAVRTEWIPEAVVTKPRETGDAIFDHLATPPETSPLNTKWLSEAAATDLARGLDRLAQTYRSWIGQRQAEIPGLAPRYQTQAQAHIDNAGVAADRIEAGIGLLGRDAAAREAFQLACRAIWLQDSWKKAREGKAGQHLVWRPFQLAFVLLCLVSASEPEDQHRKTMDLLWFPTGGGKTEAYLLLTAYVIFLRRLRARGAPKGAGVTVFMRYTLRLLTIQQFQRAAALICACELLRTGRADPGQVTIPSHFAANEPISIGLWVGTGSVPNAVSKAIEALERGDTATPRQLSRCPACNGNLACGPSSGKDRIEFHCTNASCVLHDPDAPLPVWTVDEDIYRVLPTLMIGTADKYAQLPRNASTGRLFGVGVNVAPPDLVIQDELHLISGPLGTISGVYEIAIDELCSPNGTRPKVIGSTATIRRADEQILALFNRATFQFPPLGLDQGNSGFASIDEADPGRLYVGVTTAGRSAKFALQAVSASLMQAAADPATPPERMDDYWTLVTYFNSLRELGGALVLMRDDVERSMEEYAARRSEPVRRVKAPIELTSRVNSSEIPDLLDQLDLKRGAEDCADSVLASNMISVGVDVTRLGLMVVNGQPKGIAEYIQATSRVGRGGVPGLVVTVYNANKARDRSRYETFSNWHRSLYRDVEASSVTPFAPRSRDRALRAAFVAMVRHLVPGMQGQPAEAALHADAIRAVIDMIVERAEAIDPEEVRDVRSELEAFLDWWLSRGPVREYWDDWGDNGLLMSAEAAAERAASRKSKRSAYPAPNSLRSVEPAAIFMLRPGKSEKEEME